MAWTGTTEGHYGVYTETLTVETSDAAGQDLTSSAIDFIPPGTDFVILANTGATNLSSDADVAIKVASTSDGTYALLKDDLITSIDNKVAAAFYDVSAYGEAPYYKIFIDSDGVQKKTDTIGLTILVRK